MRILLLVAGFAFGAMPTHGIAQAALSAPSSGTALASDVAAQHHGAMPSRAVTPCPHATIPSDTDRTGHGAMAGGHCSACLTLAPMILLADIGLAPSSDQAPGPAARLKSMAATPLERPPRIL